MAQNNVLYLGDTSLATAAGYLAGVMTHGGIGYEYVASDVAAELTLVDGRKLFILSDYPAKFMPLSVQEALLQEVRGGAGLLMIGGWESYFGMGGDWSGTPVGEALPVVLEAKDDRINCDQPALLLATREHPITSNLPWADRPPTVGGFNRFSAKAEAAVLLEVERFSALRQSDSIYFVPRERHPMLVVGACGQGRVAALATDVAPHWVGGLVDWGPGRISAQAPGAGGIEVGDLYTRFFLQLLNWVGNLNQPLADR